MGWLDAEQVLKRASLLGKTPYAAYLKRLVGELAPVVGKIELSDRIATHAKRLVV
jgi:hypothetical protein